MNKTKMRIKLKKKKKDFLRYFRTKKGNWIKPNSSETNIYFPHKSSLSEGWECVLMVRFIPKLIPTGLKLFNVFAFGFLPSLNL